MSGFLTLRDPQTTAAAHRALMRRLLNGGYTSAELVARMELRAAAHQRSGVLVDDDRLVAEATVTKGEAA